MIFRNHSNILICFSGIIIINVENICDASYFIKILWWIESKKNNKKKHLFEVKIFGKIINVFTFDQFNVSMLKSFF